MFLSCHIRVSEWIHTLYLPECQGTPCSKQTQKTGIVAANTASKRVVQKTAEATGGLIVNKIADKITSIGKTKSKENEDERQEMYIPPEKKQQIIDDLRLLWNHIKNEIPKNYKLARYNIW